MKTFSISACYSVANGVVAARKKTPTPTSINHVSAWLHDASAFLFQTDRPTVIEYDDHEYLFEGFSLFSHTPLTNVSLLCCYLPTFLSLIVTDHRKSTKYHEATSFFLPRLLGNAFLISRCHVIPHIF